MADSNYTLTGVAKLLERRAKKTKVFWLSCVPFPSRKRLGSKQRSASTSTVCDGQTQTTPTVEKTFCNSVGTETEGCLLMPAESCVVDSSRHSLGSDSDTYMESCDSHDNGDDCEGIFDSIPESKFGNCPCMERKAHVDICEWRLHENAILEKLTDLQHEVNSIRYRLGSLQTDDEKATALDEYVSLQVASPPLPPPLPPPPPPFPSSPIFQHSVSVQSLTQRRSASKIQLEDTSTTQDRGIPIITLEDLQKVKLRQVTSVANVKI